MGLPYALISTLNLKIDAKHCKIYMYESCIGSVVKCDFFCLFVFSLKLKFTRKAFAFFTQLTAQHRHSFTLG